MLWMPRCCMSEMDGISALNALQELYVSYNELHELNPLCMLERLRVLDLEGKTLSLPNLLALRSLCSFSSSQSTIYLLVLHQ